MVKDRAPTSDLVLTLIDRIGLAGAVGTLDAHRRGMNRAAQGDDLTAVQHLAALHDDAATFEAWLREHLAVRRQPGGVTLSTVHRVKGQEWPHVVVHLADAEQYPHRLAEDVEEERRLFHVAITRASAHATVVTGPSPSPFVAELTTEPSADPAERRVVSSHRPEPVKRTASPSKSDPTADLDDAAQQRFSALKDLRHQLRDGKPAYVVFDNKTLVSIARMAPTSKSELREDFRRRARQARQVRRSGHRTDGTPRRLIHWGHEQFAARGKVSDWPQYGDHMTIGSDLFPLHERPVWRGRMHAWAFIAAIPAGITLIVVSERAAARTSAVIYAATLLLVFGTSAAYHRLAKTDRTRRIMQRLDHTMIYLLIAGTYVPVCLVALPPQLGRADALGRRRHGRGRDDDQAGRFPNGAVARLCAVSDHGVGARLRRAGAGRQPDVDPARADRRRWRRLHDRVSGAARQAAESVAAHVRLSRGVALVHRRRRECSTSPP